MPRAKDGFKVCSRKDCALAGQPQPVSAFGPRKISSDGLRSYCRPCGVAYALRWTRNNRERKYKAIRSWQRAHPDVVRQYKLRSKEKRKEHSAEVDRRWRQRNKERIAERNRRRYKNNKERLAEYRRMWALNNKEKLANSAALRAQRLAAAPGGPFTKNRTDYRSRWLLYGGLCAYCRVAKAKSLEHAIPVSRGGGNWAANIYPACGSCNSSKHTKKLWSEWVPPYARSAK